MICLFADDERCDDLDDFFHRPWLVEDLLTTAFSADEREREYEERIADLEREVERLNRERRQLLEQREENQELVRFAEEHRSLVAFERERRKKGVFTRAWWWFRGEPD